MNNKLILPLLILIYAFFLQCSNAGKFSKDAAIQKDITSAVNNYSSDNWEIRLNAVKSISKYSNSIYVKNTILLLILALEDSHSEIRIESLKILKKIKAPSVEEKLRQIAVTEENPNVKHYIYSALEDYGNIKNEKLFIRGLEDRDWLVQEAALKGLMKINDPAIQSRHLSIILNAVKNRNVTIKLAAISSIAIKDPSIYIELARIINNKESKLVILKAALQKIRGYKLDEKTKKRIIEMLTHRDKNIRVLSLQALKDDEISRGL